MWWQKIYKCTFTLKFPRTRRCAKKNGMDSTLITKSCCITRGPKTTFCFWEMMTEERDKHHLPHQFNKKNMKQLKFFKESRSLMHHFTWKTCKQKAMGVTLHRYWELTHEKNKILQSCCHIHLWESCLVIIVHMNNLQSQNNTIHTMQKHILWT
jgi:hypothetical protein